jgi:predicted amino acid dehydrogenase
MGSEPRSRLSQSVYEYAMRRLPVPPVRIASVRLDAHCVGNVILAPIEAQDLQTRPREARRRVNEAVDFAAQLGVSVLGLGGLTATATAEGVSLRGRTDVRVTNGHAFTATILQDQVRMLLARTPSGRVAIVGATGSVGATVAKLLVRGREADELVLVAQDERRRQSLACNLSGRGVAVRAAASLHGIRHCDVVVLASAAGPALEPLHLGVGAVVLDAGQPRAASADLARCRPDVLVLDGGLVTAPSFRLSHGGLGLPDGFVPAALAETALLSFSGQPEHFCLGMPNLGQVDQVRSLATQYASLGFRAALPSSSGMPVGAESVSEPHAIAA